MKLHLTFMLLLLMFGLSACKQGEQEETVPTSAGNKEVTEEKLPDESPFIYPLTGLPSKEESLSEQRPISVMINNHPDARPQSGLNQADLVYEILAEGDVTRFLAIFQSEKPDVIGPVRSARDYYVDLSKGYHSLYVSHGWSPSAQEKLEAGEADYLNGLFYDGTLFWRANHRKAPHNSYISFNNIEKGAEQNQYSFEASIEPISFYEENDPPIDGEKVNKVTVEYSKNTVFQADYEFDEDTSKYIRISNGEQTVDLETNEPVLIDNLFIVEMNHKFVDDYGRRKIDLQSGGKAILLQKGLMREVEWINENNRILPTINGEIIPFVKGKTWINIVPSLDKVKL